MENINLSLPLITLTLLTLHCAAYSISFILESLLLFAKDIFIPKLFLIEHLKSVLSHLVFKCLEPLPDGVYLFKTMET